MYKRYENCEICVFAYPREPIIASFYCKLKEDLTLRHRVCPAFIPLRKYKGQTKPY